MSNMFCFQCEQTIGGKGCTIGGVCGKNAEAANKQDELTCSLVGLARAAEGKIPGPKAEVRNFNTIYFELNNWYK